MHKLDELQVASEEEGAHRDVLGSSDIDVLQEQVHEFYLQWKRSWAVERTDEEAFRCVDKFDCEITRMGLQLTEQEHLTLLQARALLELKLHNAVFHGSKAGFANFDEDDIWTSSTMGYLDDLSNLETVDVALLESAILYYLKFAQAIEYEDIIGIIKSSFIVWQRDPDDLRKFTDTIEMYFEAEFQIVPEIAILLKRMISKHKFFIVQAGNGGLLRPEAWRTIGSYLNRLDSRKREKAWGNICHTQEIRGLASDSIEDVAHRIFAGKTYLPAWFEQYNSFEECVRDIYGEEIEELGLRFVDQSRIIENWSYWGNTAPSDFYKVANDGIVALELVNEQGLVQFGTYCHEGVRYGEIANVHVLEEARGVGTGKKLSELAARILTEIGDCDALFCELANEKLIPVVEANGFESNSVMSRYRLPGFVKWLRQ